MSGAACLTSVCFCADAGGPEGQEGAADEGPHAAAAGDGSAGGGGAAEQTQGSREVSPPPAEAAAAAAGGGEAAATVAAAGDPATAAGGAPGDALEQARAALPLTTRLDLSSITGLPAAAAAAATAAAAAAGPSVTPREGQAAEGGRGGIRGRSDGAEGNTPRGGDTPRTPGSARCAPYFPAQHLSVPRTAPVSAPVLRVHAWFYCHHIDMAEMPGASSWGPCMPVACSTAPHACGDSEFAVITSDALGNGQPPPFLCMRGPGLCVPPLPTWA